MPRAFFDDFQILRRGCIDHMHIPLRERNCQAVGFQGILDIFGDIILDIPIIGGIAPRTDDIVDAAVGQFLNADKWGGGFQHLRMFG